MTWTLESKVGKVWSAVVLAFVGVIATMALTTAQAAQDTTGKAGSSTSRYRRPSSSSSYESSYDRSLDSRQRDSIFGSRTSERSSNRMSRETRDKSRAKASNEPGAKGAQPPPKTEKTVKGKKPPAKKAAKGGQNRPATAVEFKMRASPSTNLLSIESTDVTPLLHTIAQVGQTFSTRIVFRNGQQGKFDSVELALRYDPQFLELEGIDDSALASLTNAAPVARVDRQRGILVYRAKFGEPRKDDFLVLFRLRWKALAPTERTSIDFLNTPSFPTRVLADGKNLLAAGTLDEENEEDTLEPSPRRGLLGADVAIAPTADLQEQQADEESSLGGMALARQISEGSASGGIQLWLRPREAFVRVGQEVLVDAVFENPNRVEIDSVKLTIIFDPRVLEVVDDDANNWITKGINIFDGDYHEELPFDYHIRNVAYNSLGRIYYQMGFSHRTRLPARGTIATIRFRALAPADASTVRFDFDEAQQTQPTSISFLGFNLIGSPDDRARALHPATISVAP